jgi:hypothetical protein
MKAEELLQAAAPEPANRTEAKRDKKSTLSMRQIDHEIAAFRRERRLSSAASKRRA